MDNLPTKAADAYVEAARAEFKAFYSKATPIDSTKMDRLIHLHRVLAEAYKARQMPGAPQPDPTARSTNSAEREFIRTRFEISNCPTFRALTPGDRKRIESVLFDPFAPME